MSGVIYPINDKKYTAEDVEIFNCTRTSGVYSVLDFDYSLSGNVLTVGKGLAWIKNGDFSGKAIAFKDVTTITLDSADDTLDRYDVVAVRYDATKTEPEIVVIKGTASKTPTIPTRNTQSYLYELFLCSILRKAGESTVSFENVTDLRENKKYCGIMEDSVTSAVAPVYETLCEGVSLGVGDTVNIDNDKYAVYIATLHNTATNCNVVLSPLSGTNSVYIGGDTYPTMYFRVQMSVSANDPKTGTLTVCQWGDTPVFTNPAVNNAKLIKLVGVTKQPKGYVAVDDVYNPKSHNAQSGEAVKQAVEEALAEFEPPEQESGSGVSEAQRQTLMAVVNAIGLFNVPNAQELLDNFNKAWDVVEPVPATSITLDKTEITFASEEPQTLVASVLPANTTDVVVWKSSDTSIATVKNGVVTPLIDGETVITARAGNVSAMCNVVVNLDGDIENPVYMYSGVIDNTSTATSAPVASTTYPNAIATTAIPVKNGDTVSIDTNIKQPQTYFRWRFYDESGTYVRNLDFAETVTIRNNGFVRLNVLDTGRNVIDGETFTYSNITVTDTAGTETVHTVVDKR